MLALSIALHAAAVAFFGKRAQNAPRAPEPSVNREERALPVQVEAQPFEPPPLARQAPAPEPVAAMPEKPRSTSPRKPRIAKVPGTDPPAATSAGEAKSGAADESALTRTLRRVAATPELTREQKRKAMLALLRTWEGRTDPDDAERMIDQLLSDH